MWLLPAFSPIARVATNVYYRLRVDGRSVPTTGPALLVANHPNSLLDPALVVAVAGRPVRFLAKAPLFTDRLVGWLVRGSGSIPVHRRQDDAGAMSQNVDSFDAAYRALADGAAIGIFPEGLSHDEPTLAQLRTGAARIALGAAQQGAGAFPIIPIGLVFRDKEAFRSDARVLIGRAIVWGDLAHAGEQDMVAVRELTARIDNALRDVTLNLERWEDAPLVEAADAIWTAETGSAANDVDRMQRLRLGTSRLAELRRSGDTRWQQVARDVLRHARLLKRLDMTPADLHGESRYDDAARWTVRRLPLLLAGVLALAGAIPFWPAYRLTGIVAERMRPDQNVRSTTKLLVGILIYAGWLIILVVMIGMLSGIAWALVAAVLLPTFALLSLHLREQWRDSLRDVRRFFLLRSRRRLIADLRVRQQRLAQQIASATVEPADRERAGGGTPLP